jgi:hypothetical protein
MTKFGMNVAATVIFASWATFAFAGEGSGYNGPITAGDSIPVQLDRAVSLNGLTRTYQVCASRMAADIASQYAKLTPAEFELSYSEYDFNGGLPKWDFHPDGQFFDVFFSRNTTYSFMNKDPKADTKSIIISFAQSSGFHLGREDHYNSSEISYPSLGVKSHDGTQARTYFKNFKLPFAMFNNTLNQAKYDELGNLDNSTLILDGLTLKIPAEYQDQVILINSQSSLPTSLKANLKAYVDCFQNEIQK